MLPLLVNPVDGLDNREILEDKLNALDEEASWHDFVETGRSADQMSKSPLNNDIDGLKRLIAEKEKDLELAARIGQSLLSKNNILQHNHDELVQLYTLTQDELTQLRHELVMNKELLRVCLNEEPDEYDDELDSTEHPSIRQIQLLQRKIRFLEDENHRLRLEAKDLSVEAANFDTQETEIIHDCVKELAESNVKIQGLTESLKRKSEENAALQEEVASLLTDMVDLQTRMKKAVAENDELKETQETYKENQNQLASELIQLQTRFERLSAYVQELEEEAKELKRKDHYIQSWADMSNTYTSYTDSSLAAELNVSLQHIFNSVGYPEDDKDDTEELCRKVIDVVRLANVQMPRSQAQTSTVTVNPSNACISSAASSRCGSARKSVSSSQNGDESLLDAPLGSYFSSGVFLDNSRVINSESSSLISDDISCDKSGVRCSFYSNDGRHCATPDSAVSFGASSEVSEISARTVGHSQQFSCEKLIALKPYFEDSKTLGPWKNLANDRGMTNFMESHDGIITKAHSDQVEKNIAEVRKENTKVVDRGMAGTFRDLQTISGGYTNTTTFTSSRNSSSGSLGLFSGIGAITKNERTSSSQLVFPQPITKKDPAVALAKILNSSSEKSSSDEIIKIVEDSSPRTSEGRSRRSSGSLSSASRSPSPPVEPSKANLPVDPFSHLSKIYAGSLTPSLFGKQKTGTFSSQQRILLAAQANKETQKTS